MTVDASTHTLYAANENHHRIDVFATSRCNVRTRSHCAPVGSIPVAHPAFALSHVDDATHTLYGVDQFVGDATVIDTASCNASTTTGCGSAVKAKVHVGDNAGDVAEDPVTHTLYVVYGPFDNTPNFVGVLDVSACTAADTSGCSQTPATAPVGPGANSLAVSAATNTVYVSNTGTESSGLGHTVSVINGATCNGTVHSGCATPAASVNVGTEPFGIAVDDADHSVYVVANANGDTPEQRDRPGQQHVQRDHHDGMRRLTSDGRIGRSGLLAAVDPDAHKVYVSDFSSAAVSVVNARRATPAQRVVASERCRCVQWPRNLLASLSTQPSTPCTSRRLPGRDAVASADGITAPPDKA